MISTAWAADGSEGTFSDPTFWVAVAFVLFFVLVGKVLWTRLTGMRADAQKAKADAESTLAQAAAEADAILGQAREEVARMQARAKTSLENAIVLREQQAKDRIAQAEAAATKQVRDTAVDVALTATRALLREQVGNGNTQATIDQAIAELPRRLH